MDSRQLRITEKDRTIVILSVEARFCNTDMWSTGIEKKIVTQFLLIKMRVNLKM